MGADENQEISTAETDLTVKQITYKDYLEVWSGLLESGKIKVLSIYCIFIIFFIFNTFFFSACGMQFHSVHLSFLNIVAAVLLESLDNLFWEYYNKSTRWIHKMLILSLA